MTAQVRDTIIYNGDEYYLADCDLFDPSLYGLNPCRSFTACIRGYQSIYAVFEKHLVLDSLRLTLPAEENKSTTRPYINGVAPTGPADEIDVFNCYYEKLCLPLKYSGALLIRNGGIDVPTPLFRPALKHAKVIELMFTDGILQKEIDRSGMSECL